MSLAATAEGFFHRGFLRTVENYCKLMAGTSARLGLQAVYFFILANTLSLADMGLFAGASAVGLMIASFAGFGFGSYAFRAAAGKPRLLGRYMGLFYGGLAITTPIGLVASLPFFFFLFDGVMSLAAWTGIILVEILLWRMIETFSMVQNGMGRFTAGALAITIAAAIRCGGAVAFLLAGGGDIGQWTLWYVASNCLALSIGLTAFYPPVKARFSWRLLRTRLRDGMMFSLSYFALNAQGQIDKLIVLTLTDARFAGIYAISTRILEFTALPFRSFYVLYTKKLFAEGKRISNALSRTLKVEGVILGLSTLAILALNTALWFWPNLLGPNVAVAAHLFMLMLMVPAFRNLIEFHGELFFVHGRMTARAVIAIGLVTLNMALLALLLSLTSDLAAIALGLNGIYGLLYVLSAAALFRFIHKGHQGTRT